MCNALDTPALLTMNPTCRLACTAALLLGMTLLARRVEGNILQNFLRNNIAGPDVNFQDLKVPFDPDEGERLSKEYQAVNGRYGWKAVERVGLGVDGKTEERRVQQQYRDSIGGLSYRVPGYVGYR